MIIELTRALQMRFHPGDRLRWCRNPGAFYDALTEGGADAALAASLFHYKELEIREVKDYLAEKGISVRR